MRRAILTVLLLAGISILTLETMQTANAMAGEYGKADPKHPVSSSGWPAGLEVVVNRADRIGGWWVNSNDTFYYAGNAADFNNFLKDYSRVQSNSLTLIIDNSSGPPGLFQPTNKNANWQMGTSGWSTSTATVTMPLHGRISLKDMKVPLNITVYTFGDKEASAEAFVAAHNAAQQKARKSEHPKQ
jgi:hypothetical protein